MEARATRTPRHWAALPLTPHHPPTPPRPTRRHRQGRDGLTGGATPVPSRGSAEGRTAGRGPTAEGKQHPAPSRLLIGQNDPPNTHPPLTSPPLYYHIAAPLGQAAGRGSDWIKTARGRRCCYDNKRTRRRHGRAPELPMRIRALPRRQRPPNGRYRPRLLQGGVAWFEWPQPITAVRMGVI